MLWAQVITCSALERAGLLGEPIPGTQMLNSLGQRVDRPEEPPADSPTLDDQDGAQDDAQDGATAMEPHSPNDPPTLEPLVNNLRNDIDKYIRAKRLKDGQEKLLEAQRKKLAKLLSGWEETGRCAFLTSKDFAHMMALQSLTAQKKFAEVAQLKHFDHMMAWQSLHPPIGLRPI